jgi:hypothetical protein
MGDPKMPMSEPSRRRSGAGRQSAARFIAAAGLLISTAALLTGCPPPPEQRILPREELLTRHNERAGQLVHLWSECRITVRMPRDLDDGRPRPGTGYQTHTVDGNFILRKPRDLYLEGRVFGSPQFGLHSNEAMFWLYVRPTNTAYVGRYGGPGIREFPIPPDQILRGLGIYTVGEGDEVIVFRRGDERDVIQVLRTYTPADLRRISATRFAPFYIAEEIYLERFEHQPAEVRVYDLLGEVALRSTLTDYRPITIYGQIVPTEEQLLDDPFLLPQVDRTQVLGELPVAHRIVYHLPTPDVTVTLVLRNVDLSITPDPEAFLFRRPPVENVIDLDAQAAPPETPSPPMAGARGRARRAATSSP